LVKKRQFGQISRICSKIPKNRKFRQKSKGWSNNQNLVKNPEFGQNLGKTPTSRIYGQTPTTWSKKGEFVGEAPAAFWL